MAKKIYKPRERSLNTKELKKLIIKTLKSEKSLPNFQTLYFMQNNRAFIEGIVVLLKKLGYQVNSAEISSSLKEIVYPNTIVCHEYSIQLMSLEEEKQITSIIDTFMEFKKIVDKRKRKPKK